MKCLLQKRCLGPRHTLPPRDDAGTGLTSAHTGWKIPLSLAVVAEVGGNVHTSLRHQLTVTSVPHCFKRSLVA